jgi:hypothetical protein
MEFVCVSIVVPCREVFGYAQSIGVQFQYMYRAPAESYTSKGKLSWVLKNACSDCHILLCPQCTGFDRVCKKSMRRELAIHPDFGFTVVSVSVYLSDCCQLYVAHAIPSVTVHPVVDRLHGSESCVTVCCCLRGVLLLLNRSGL